MLFNEPDAIDTVLELSLTLSLSLSTIAGCIKLSLLPLSMSALTSIPLMTISVVDFPRLGIGFGLEIAADTLLRFGDSSSHKKFGLNIAEAVDLSSEL